MLNVFFNKKSIFVYDHFLTCVKHFLLFTSINEFEFEFEFDSGNNEELLKILLMCC